MKTGVIRERSNGVVRISNKSFDRYMSNRFGDSYWDYRESWDNPQSLSYPVQINVEINDRCNLRCRMCPRSTNKYRLNTGTIMPFLLFKKVIDEGCLKAIAFGGGDEPLLNRELPQMIKYASIKGVMDIRVTTNGTMLNKELSRELMESGVTWVSVSLDAVSKDKYNEIRAGSDYNRVESNINGFIELKQSMGVDLPVLRVSIIDMGDKDEIVQFQDKWVNRVDYIDVQRYVNYVDEISGGIKQTRCLDPFRRLWVKADGNVYPCCNFLCVRKEHDNELLLGNVYETSVKELWDGKKLGDIRKRIGSFENLPVTCIDCLKRWNRVVEQ